MTSALTPDRAQILAFRRRVGSLDERLPMSPASLRRAAWAGLQDSMPRAAVLSIHARVAGATPSSWDDQALVQIYGPRFSLFAVAVEDAPVFTVGRYPDDTRGRAVAEEMAAAVQRITAGGRMRDRDIGLGNRIRYATTTGTIRLRWPGALAPVVWTVPRPDVEPFVARLELARRYLHVYGPTTLASFATWAGIGAKEARAAFEALAGELLPVMTPIGEAVALAADERELRAPAARPAPARLLPSGDAFFLLQGIDRELLVPDARRRGELWTSRVWPGAVLVDGDVVGVWRRAGAKVSIDAWRALSGAERESIEAEAASLPLPDLEGRIRVSWGS